MTTPPRPDPTDTALGETSLFGGRLATLTFLPASAASPYVAHSMQPAAWRIHRAQMGRRPSRGHDAERFVRTAERPEFFDRVGSPVRFSARHQKESRNNGEHCDCRLTPTAFACSASH